MFKRIKALLKGKIKVENKEYLIKELNLTGLIIAILYNLYFISQNMAWETIHYIPRKLSYYLVENHGKRSDEPKP